LIKDHKRRAAPNPPSEKQMAVNLSILRYSRGTPEMIRGAAVTDAYTTGVKVAVMVVV